MLDQLSIDYEKIIKVLESCKTEKHLDSTLALYKLWEKKYIFDVEEKTTLSINIMRSNFWAEYKTKRLQIGKPYFI